MKETILPILTSVIRHGLTAIGGGVAVVGATGSDTAEIISGALIVLVGQAWSIFKAWKENKK